MDYLLLPNSNVTSEIAVGYYDVANSSSAQLKSAYNGYSLYSDYIDIPIWSDDYFHTTKNTVYDNFFVSLEEKAPSPAGSPIYFAKTANLTEGTGYSVFEKIRLLQQL